VAHESAAREGERAITLAGLVELVARNARLCAVVSSASLLASALIVAQRAPSFRARATLILEQGAGAGGLLGELALLGEGPRAAGQIEILRARSTAEAVVAEPPDESRAARQMHLGLTTLVEDPRLEPARGLLFAAEPEGQHPPRLRARFGCADEFDELRELEVEFLSATRVRVAERGWWSSLEPLEVDLAPGPIAFGAASLELEPEGDLTGRTFRLRRLTRDEAIERVLRATRVRETERNSGVIELTVDDSDPRRAAETVNALCQNYLARDEERGDRKVSHTLEFIRTSLVEQTSRLREAEGEVVALQREHPRAINVVESARALIEQLSALEAQRVQIELSRVSTRQAVDLIARGDLAALSQLSVELSDPITAAYLENIAKLEAESALQVRSDTGPFKLLLQQHQVELEAALDRGRLEVERLAAVVTAVDAGEHGALSSLGGGPPAARDPLLESFLSTYAELLSRGESLARTQTEAHPDRVRHGELVAATVQRIRDLVAARLGALREQAREEERLLADYRERGGRHPAEERARIADAIQSLRARTGEHLAGRLAGLQRSDEALRTERERIERELGALPDDERRVADPLRRLTAQTEIVKLLLQKEQEAQIALASTIAGAEFIDLAVPPIERSGPSIALHLLAGLLVGVAAALGLATAKETFARGVFTVAELEEVSRLAVLGAIPDFRRGRYKLRGAGARFVALRDDPQGVTAEAYRSLRANLKFVFSGERTIRSIAATSCTPGEGKSTTNLALAMSFARSGQRVVLVDCDMRRPSIDQYLRLPLAPGLTDVLEGRAAWRDVCKRGVVERLDVLTAGRQSKSPSDLLDGPGFGALIDELEREYDLVVCDVPPAMAAADIESCAARLDALLLVVRCNKPSAALVADVARRLAQSGAHVVGALLNGVGSSLVNGKYGDGHGYGYGQANDAERRAAG
jgi:capsular exopolysaccharide synthesis family protein